MAWCSVTRFIRPTVATTTIARTLARIEHAQHSHYYQHRRRVVTWFAADDGSKIVTARSFSLTFADAVSHAVDQVAVATQSTTVRDDDGRSAWVIHSHMHRLDETLAATARFWASVVGSTPLIGASTGSFRYGSSSRPFVSMSLLRLPPSVAIEAWCIGSSLPLPRLGVVAGPFGSSSTGSGSAWASRLAAASTDFLFFAHPSAPSRGVDDLVRRLSSLFPTCTVAAGTAMRVFRGEPESARLFYSSGRGDARTGTGEGAEAASEVSATRVGAVGFALHRGRGESSVRFTDAAVVAAFADAEFERTGTSSGFTTSPSLFAKLFSPAAVAAVKHAAPLPHASNTSATSGSATASTLTPPPATSTASTGGLAPRTAKVRPAQPSVVALFAVEASLFPGASADYELREPRYLHMLRQHVDHGLPVAVCLPPARVADWYELQQLAETSQRSRAGKQSSSGLDAESPPPPLAHVATLDLDAQAPTIPSHAGGTAPSTLPRRGGQSDLDAWAASTIPSDAVAPPLSLFAVQRSRVATIASISVLQSDRDGHGRAHVRMRGIGRVRVLDAWTAPGTFGLTLARVEPLAEQGDDNDDRSAAAVAAAIRTAFDSDGAPNALLRRVARAWSPRVCGSSNDALALPPAATTTPSELSWWLADVLPVPVTLKQTWLDMDSTTERLQRQLAYIESKLADLSQVATPRTAEY